MSNYIDPETPIYETVVKDLKVVPNAGRITAPALPAGVAMVLASVERVAIPARAARLPQKSA